MSKDKNPFLRHLVLVITGLLLTSQPLQGMLLTNQKKQASSAQRALVTSGQTTPWNPNNGARCTITPGTKTTHSNNKANIVQSPMSNNENNPVNNNSNIVNVTLIGGLSQLVNSGKYKHLAINLLRLCGATARFMIRNKKTTLLGLISSLYLALNFRLMYLHAKLKNPNSWSQWRSTLALEQLYLIPRQTLYSDLLTNIQTKYTNFRNFRDNLAPLSSFLKDAEQEESFIKQYTSIVKVLKSLHISGMVFYSHKLHKNLKKRSSRLLFIKSAFLNWYADHKLSNPEKEVLVRRFPRVKDILDKEEKNRTINTQLIQPLLPEESTDLILENIIVI